MRLKSKTLHPARPVCFLAIGIAVAFAGCGPPREASLPGSDGKDVPLEPQYPAMEIFEPDYSTLERVTEPDPLRRAYFGDLHVHTTYSVDAYAFGTMATPSDAYRYARGERIAHPGGFDVQLREPLDFYAVTDHAMFLGVAGVVADPNSIFSKFEFAQALHGINDPDNLGIGSLPMRVRTFGSLRSDLISAVLDEELSREDLLAVTKSAWQKTIEAADRWNDPGRFTTFAAYEYTSSSDDRGNLHRNVIFRDTYRLPAIPFSRFHSQNPEGLWDWMDRLRDMGIESLAIPHNSNGSNGQMFKWVDWVGDPLTDAYGRRRMRNEPLVEITQVKGTSETHPSLSDTDEWAGFEITPYRVATMLQSEPAGSYVRDALRRGLSVESGGITNPYRFGFVGASDTHTGAISDDEANFFSKLGILDSTAEMRGSIPMGFVQATLTRFAAPDLVTEVDGAPYTKSATPTYGASGLTGVWAEENTRSSLYRAFRRKETFATSGPRISVRVFAGVSLLESWLDSSDGLRRADETGVPMGGELALSENEDPSFLIWATRDPASAPLARVQVVKGWEDGGETFERVIDVACSEGLDVDPETSRCPNNGAKVDLDDCSISTDKGASELRALWRDTDYEPGQRAFYYIRVLENPTCRWSTWDAIRADVEPRSDLPKTIQERAWSSPIQVSTAQ